MTDVVIAGLALALGLLAGLGAGVAVGIRIAAIRRANLGANAQLARLWPAELPARSSADILAGVIRVVLGGQTFELPVLPRATSRAWLQSLDERFAVLANELEAAGNDTPLIMARLVAEADGLYEMLLSYDQAGVLPPKAEMDAIATDTEILRAVLEVWRAVNPLAATVAEKAAEQTQTPLPTPPTSPRTSTAGGPSTSSASSPTSSSSGTSTPPRTASSASRRQTTSEPSKPSASARSSRTTRSSTPAGATARARRPAAAAASSGLSSKRP